MHKLTILVLVVVLLAVQSVKMGKNRAKEHASGKRVKMGVDVVYYNGNIITMHEGNEAPRFVAVSKDVIVAVGRTEEEMEGQLGKNTKLVNLHGRTLIPGLVDAHSHFSATATRLSQGVNIAPPPFGPASSIPALLDSIKTYITTNNIPAGQVITAGGYNDLDMAEGRHPTRF